MSANLDDISMGEGIERLQDLADETLSPGFRTALAGQSKDFAEGTSALAQLFFLSLLFVFLLLAAQFDSFLAPVSILLSVPLALAGAFAALLITGSTLSFFAQVGLILLVGLVTKNGILIVEYAQQVEKAEGVSPWEAAERATMLRFRPILMTSVATIGGAIPIALGLSGSSRTGLGIAVVGGMLSATALTLYVTPVVYAVLASLRLRRTTVEAVAKLALGGLVLGHAATARAETLTLGNALAIALDQNIAIRTAEANLTSAEAFHDVTRAVALPSASVDGIAYTRNEVLADEFPQTHAEAYAELDVPLLALSTLAVARAAHFDELAARSDRDDTVEDSLATVAGRFVAFQQAREAVVAAQAQYDNAKRLANLASSRVEVGAAPAIDRTRAQLELKSAEARSIAARTTEYAAGLDLANDLGVAIDSAVDVVAAVPLVEPTGLPSDAELDAALAGAQDDRPEIVAARARLSSVEALRRAKNLEAAPTLGAYGKAGAATDLRGRLRSPAARGRARRVGPALPGRRPRRRRATATRLERGRGAEARHRGARRRGGRAPLAPPAARSSGEPRRGPRRSSARRGGARTRGGALPCRIGRQPRGDASPGLRGGCRARPRRRARELQPRCGGLVRRARSASDARGAVMRRDPRGVDPIRTPSAATRHLPLRWRGRRK